MSQTYKSRERHSSTEETDQKSDVAVHAGATATAATVSAEANTTIESIDELLDEIDNTYTDDEAKELVDNFRQVGGQ
jgi:hypothetical protein